MSGRVGFSYVCVRCESGLFMYMAGPVFNLVAPNDICFLTCICLWLISKNLELFVCCCRTWIYLDITRRYQEQRQPFIVSAWRHAKKRVNWAPIAGVGGIDTICTAACQNRCDSSTTCRLYRLEPLSHIHILSP